MPRVVTDLGLDRAISREMAAHDLLDDVLGISQQFDVGLLAVPRSLT